MVRFYEIAGIVIRVILPEEYEYSDERVLQEYTVKEGPYTHTLKIYVVDKLSMPVGKCTYRGAGLQIYIDEDTQMHYIGTLKESVKEAYQCIIRKGNYSVVQIEKSSVYKKITTKMVLNAMEIEHLLAMNNGILLHASNIEWRGKSILFTAPSETGKSTQADLWCDYAGAELINGDRAAVVVKNNEAVAMGIPFSGSSTVCKNKSFPLKAIVYLAQSKENYLEKLEGLTSFRKVWEGCSVNVWNKEDMQKSVDTVNAITTEVPVYLLKCRKDEDAVQILRQELERQENYEK